MHAVRRRRENGEIRRKDFDIHLVEDLIDWIRISNSRTKTDVKEEKMKNGRKGEVKVGALWDGRTLSKRGVIVNCCFVFQFVIRTWAIRPPSVCMGLMIEDAMKASCNDTL